MSIYFLYKKRILFILWGIVFIGFLFLFWINIFIVSFSNPHIYANIKELPAVKVWIVLWASVYKSGIPSDILKDRLNGALLAYKYWKIKKIIVSWDNSSKEYDEPTNMKNYLVKYWVDSGDIYLDYAGFDTYDSLYRAREVFSVYSISIFTQEFHLPRSIFIAKSLWMEAYGFETDYHTYTSQRWNNIRESFARVKAWFDVYIWHSKSKFLGEKVVID